MKTHQQFKQGQRVTVNTDVYWTDENDVERITRGPSKGIIAAVDERPSCTVYEIHLDSGAGYFLFNPDADGDVVQAE